MKTVARIALSLFVSAAPHVMGGCVMTPRPAYGGPMETVAVDARTLPTGPSSIYIAPGTSAVIQANGVWSVGGPYGMFGPEGTAAAPRFEPGALLPSAPMGALIGSFDGTRWFPIGIGPTQVPGAGQLWLAANDAPPAGNFTDNSGSLNVIVTRPRP